MEPSEINPADGSGAGRATALPGATLWPLLVALSLFAFTEIPYAIGLLLRPPSGFVFGGILEWIEDEDMYFSFIRQAADGRVLFLNRLTALDHGRVYFNPQFWLVGRVMAWLDDSSVWAYQVWRAAGALSAILGFSALSSLMLRDWALRRVALIMCAFGGGFSWTAAVLKRIDPNLLADSSGPGWGLAIETITGTHPFQQVLGNPNFSFPLGLFLLAVACYVRGELTGSRRCYAIAAALAFVEGSMRPYDLIALDTMIPLFLLIELVATHDLQLRRFAWRILPIVATAPLLAYNVYIFKFHPIFKYWGSQGHSIVIGVHWHFLSLGLGGLLLAARLLMWKSFPLRTSAERLLLAWVASVFFFAHSHKLPLLSAIPYTFQLISTMMPPIIILGVVVLDPARWTRAGRPSAAWWALIAAFLFLNSLTSVRLVYLYGAGVRAHPELFHLKDHELFAYQLLDKEAGEDDVVLCVKDTGHALARYASPRVVVGHWSVTPHWREMESRAERFYRGEMMAEETAAFLKELKVTWIYWGTRERKFGAPPPQPIPGFETRLSTPDVVLYAARRPPGVVK
jgi:hypothetical protein